MTDNAFLDVNALHMFYKNADVSGHNTKMLNKEESDLASVQVRLFLPKGRKSVTKSNKGTIADTEFLEVLNIKVGARCMIIDNMDITDDLVNGQCGTVVGIERNNKGEVFCIFVNFDDESCGQWQREKHKQLSSKYKAQNGTPIFKIEKEFYLSSRHGRVHAAKAKLYQFPLRLAYAQTGHKMQVWL